MSAPISLGYSSCPNDVFIFEALVRGLVPGPGFELSPLIEDVEALNLRALGRELDITKISFHAWGHLLDDYLLLESGSALGRGCGPLLVARTPDRPASLKSLKVAIPGEWTTAALLLRLHAPEIEHLEVMVFDQILEAVRTGAVDAGLIIHESRFTYEAAGLTSWLDLGEWWEAETDCPIPLGGIIAHRRLGTERIQRFDACLKESILRAHRDPEPIWEAIRSHAQELDDDVIRSHIELYVNDFTTSLGEEGRRALRVLLERGEREGLIPPHRDDIFASEIGS